MENVMLNSIQTQIKIVDFGLSNVWTSDNPLRTHCGSPEYAAPELFVTGKEYGAEVDLWSLGIILYGMVVGQLPFVSSRSDHVSSQERRKRLVAQINKGMASPQRRAIATLSAEFRNMMNKLLVADSTKRITIKELIIHPWITDKGKKLIRTNPIKKPDDKTKLRIIREVATLLNVDSKEVIASIEREPFGKLGGMYNILIHKYTMNQLKGDGVSKNVMPINLDIERPCSRREYIFQQINSERLPKQTLSSITRNPHVPRVVLVERSPRPNTVDIPTSQHVKVKTPTSRYVNNEKCSDRSRPKTVHTQKFQEFEDYRMLKSPTHRRKAYSAALANRQVSTDDIHKNVVLGNQDENVQIVKQKTILTPRKVVRDDLSNSRNCTNQSPSTKAANSASLRPMANRAQSAVTRQQESKSDHNTKKGQTVRLVKRIIKQSGVSPVMETRSASRSQSASTKPTSTSRKTAAIQGQVNLEKSPFGHGDGLLRPHSPGVGLASQNKHPYIYDPIARSIAGYVVNNVPDKFRKFSWLRK